MIRYRCAERQAIEFACGRAHDEPLLLVDGGFQTEAVEPKDENHRSVADSFVSVDEGMIRHQRVTNCSGLVCDRWVEWFTAECRGRLGDRRLEGTSIAQPRRSSTDFDQAGMNIQDLVNGESRGHASRL